jgi:hypothetical protein
MQGPEQTTTSGPVTYGATGQQRTVNPSDYSVYVLPIILVIMALRMWRGSKVRRLRIERMWILPAIYLIAVGLMLFAAPPPMHPLVIATLVIATGAGPALGWARARMVRVSINVETHELTSQMSPWGMLVLVGLLVIRRGLDWYLTRHAAEWHISLAAITDGFLLFYLGMLVGRIAEIWIRANRLLNEARAAKAAGQTVPDEVSEDHA